MVYMMQNLPRWHGAVNEETETETGVPAATLIVLLAARLVFGFVLVFGGTLARLHYCMRLRCRYID